MELQGWSSVEEGSDPATPPAMPDDLVRSKKLKEMDKEERIKAIDESTRKEAQALKDSLGTVITTEEQLLAVLTAIKNEDIVLLKNCDNILYSLLNFSYIIY